MNVTAFIHSGKKKARQQPSLSDEFNSTQCYTVDFNKQKLRLNFNRQRIAVDKRPPLALTSQLSLTLKMLEKTLIRQFSAIIGRVRGAHPGKRFAQSNAYIV
ncbi:hypothetical protein GGQ68_002172 [Sagittula marina]|uniref:Uncharacterized protein n=1 Tax=Sagittula marina TaxID=943940 RepID=A0A7W6GU20_9RHOB|nr:hypothetical protein [Sagittula marina]MBB3985834.1 hypothetical protein [Sagittula marina]